MKFSSFRISLLALMIVSAGPAQGKVETDEGAPCEALLNSPVLKTARLGAADLAEATHGAELAVLLVRWRVFDPLRPGGDPRARGQFFGADVTYAVPPTKDLDGGVFAVAVGPRRSLLTDAARIESDYGKGQVGFLSLKRQPASWRGPRHTMTFGEGTSLALTQVVLDGRRTPDLVLIDRRSGEPFYVISDRVLGAFDDRDFIEAGVSLADAANLSAWDTHPLRLAGGNHLIRMPRHGVASYEAFHALQVLVRDACAREDVSTPPALADFLNACLDGHRPAGLTVAAPSPEPAPPIVTKAGVRKFDQFARTDLPPVAQFSAVLNGLRPDPNKIVRGLIEVLYRPGVDVTQFLREDSSATHLIERAWAYYWPGETPTQLPRQRDGRSFPKRKLAAERIIKAWRELRARAAR